MHMHVIHKIYMHAYIYTYIHIDTVCIYNIHTMEYYEAPQMKEILPVVTAWRNLVDTVLSEVHQTEEDEYCVISHVESKEVKYIGATLNGGCQGPDSEGSRETVAKGNKLAVTS